MSTVDPLTASAVLPADATRWRPPSWIPTVVAVVAALGLWELIGYTVLKSSVPPWTRILNTTRTNGWSYYWRNGSSTATYAALGFLWGNLAAIACAIVCVLFRPFERIIMPVALATYCLPIVALGPILKLVQYGDAPKITLAALACFYTTLIGANVGLRTADRTSLDVIRAYGGGRWTQFVKVRLRSALPATFAALRIAAPAAVLGAIIGEWSGFDTGLGVAMLASQSNYDIPRTWSLALAATLLSGIGYVAMSIIGNRLTTWAPKVGR